VDLGGAYYNPKRQVEALEKLLRTLPGPTAPAPPPTKQHKPGHRQHLPPDRIDKLIAGYQAGATVYELGAQFKIDRKTVSRTLRRHHIPLRRTSLRPEQINQAARLHQNGWSTAHIAEHLNTHQRTVQRRLAEKDVTMHDRNRRRLKPPARQGLDIVDLPLM
jgi:IS30 family transposase